MTTELGSTGHTDVAGQGTRGGRGPGRVLTALVVGTGLLAAGCGAGPSKIDSAAIVGGTSIPIEQVQQQFTDVLVRNPDAKSSLKDAGKFPDLTRQLVTLGVQHQLVEAVSQQEGLTASPADVAKLVDAQGGAAAAAKNSVFDENGITQHARDQVRLIELAKKYLPGLAVTVDVTFADTRDAALDRARRMAQGPDQARQVLDQDKAAGQQVQTGLVLKAIDNPENATGPLFGTAAGTVIAYQAGQQGQGGQWVVALVRKRELSASTPTPQQAQALDTIQPKILQAIGQRLMVPTADRLGVQINPRYGVWDPVAVGAAASADQTIGVEFPQRGAKQ